MAESYAAGIIPNHLFLDGNKRTGFMLAAAFLELNGQGFDATEESVIEDDIGPCEREIESSRLCRICDQGATNPGWPGQSA